MIEIRIRHDFDDKAHRLCDWPATDLDRLIPTIGGWGVIGAGEYETKDLFGQVVLGDTGAYFEIVISTEDETWTGVEATTAVEVDIDDLILLAEAVSDLTHRYAEERDGGFPDRQELIDRALRLASRIDGRLDDLSIAITGRPFE